MSDSKPELRLRSTIVALWPVTAVVAVLLALAYRNRFVLDDAYIYFRYAENLLAGHGFAWNPGYVIEGFSSLPWVLLVAAALGTGLDPLAIGLGLFAVTLVVFYRAAGCVSGSRGLNLLLLWVLGSNYTFSSFATSGLETPLQVAAIVACLFAFLRLARADEASVPALAGLSVLLGLAFFVRMDSAVLIVALLGGAGVLVWRATPAGNRGGRLAALAVPAAAIAAGILIFKAAYFGDILPNTYYVKADVPPDIGRGFNYAALFYHNYLLVPLLAAVAAGGYVARRGRHDLPRGAVVGVAVTAACFLLWNAYVVRISGGFMEFRFMVPALPLLLLLVAFAYRLSAPVRPVLALLLVLAGANNLAIQLRQWQFEDRPFTYAREINRFPFYQIPQDAETVPQLQAHLEQPQDDWIGIGRALGEAFEGRQDILIGTTAAGAIPYFSKLPVVDMLGLNDRWIAREGEVLTPRPGHTRGSTPEYLMERGVHLVVGHPLMVRRSELPGALAHISFNGFSMPSPPPDSRLVAIPVNDAYAVIVLYLHRHPFIDSVIRSRRFATHGVDLGLRVDLTTVAASEEGLTAAELLRRGRPFRFELGEPRRHRDVAIRLASDGWYRVTLFNGQRELGGREVEVVRRPDDGETVLRLEVPANVRDRGYDAILVAPIPR